MKAQRGGAQRFENEASSYAHDTNASDAVTNQPDAYQTPASANNVVLSVPGETPMDFAVQQTDQSAA